jgi:hypothetical protein
LTFYVATGHENENGGSGGARTRSKASIYELKSSPPSQIASSKKVIVSRDLAQVVMAWAKLPSTLQAAIIAITKSVEGKK